MGTHEATRLRQALDRAAGNGRGAAVNPATANEAVLIFTVALTVLLAASVLTVFRQPPWVPPPPVDEGRGYPAEDGRGYPAEDGRWYQAEQNAARAWPAEPLAPYGRHAARPPAQPVPAPLPVRAPGQSGWTAPAGAWPKVSGGPPWGPAPKPPGVD